MFVISFYTFLFGSSKKIKKDTTKSNFNYIVNDLILYQTWQ